MLATIITILIFLTALLLVHCLGCITMGTIAYFLDLEKTWTGAIKKAFNRF